MGRTTSGWLTLTAIAGSTAWVASAYARQAGSLPSPQTRAVVVEIRAFGGLPIEEAAHVLRVSPSTAKRDWRTAKTWLNRELGSEVRL